MAKVFWPLIDDLIESLRKNDRLVGVTSQTPLRIGKKERERAQSLSPGGLFDFHHELNGLTIKWAAAENVPDIAGAVKLLPFKEILRDWKGVVYFDFTPDIERMKTFHPLDFFVDEACVGAFLDETKESDPSLHLYTFEDKPIRLNLNIDGYVRMLVLSKGFLYWQYALLEILEAK